MEQCGHLCFLLRLKGCVISLIVVTESCDLCTHDYQCISTHSRAIFSFMFFHFLCLFSFFFFSFFFLFLSFLSFSIIFFHVLSCSLMCFFFVGCSKSDFFGALRFLLTVLMSKNQFFGHISGGGGVPLWALFSFFPPFVFSTVFLSFFLLFIFSFFSFFVHFFIFLIF